MFDIAHHLALEQQLLEDFARTSQSPRRLVWECERALVASQLDTLLPRFDEAARASADDGWPVTVRRTGGSAVALGPGVLNYSVVESWRGTPPSLAHGFDLVCTPIVRALAKLGLKGAIGPAPGSFCDGKYNVLVHGKKIAGTAQRRTKRGDGGALLVHALVLVDADPGALTGVVQRFYERAGGEQRFDATVVTSLARQLPAICAAELRKRTAESLVQ